MIVNHNIGAMFAQRHLRTNSMVHSKSLEKLSSGLRINRAGDDASGLAVSEKMRAQIRGLKRSAMNAEDGISFIQTTEGYLQNTQEILHRIRELAVQSANGIYTNEDRGQIQVEVSQLIDEIDRVASHAQFNTLNMLTGRFDRPTSESTPSASMWFHIGANIDQRERVYISTMTSKSLGIKDSSSDKVISLSTLDQSNQAISNLDMALNRVSKQRADLGAYQNRLEYTVEGILIGYENLQASESRIRDVDMSNEMIQFTKQQILMQSSTAMLAQANVKPLMVLKLLSS